MKLSNTISALFLGLSLSATAAIYFPSNVVSGSGSGDALLQNADDTLNSGGFVAMGYFPSGYVISTIDMDLNISNFTTVASVLSGSSSVSLGGAFPGYYEGDVVDTANIVPPSLLIGRPLYVFAGNLGTLAGSNEWAIKEVAVIASDDPNEQTYVGNPLGGAAPAFGLFGSFTGDASGFGSSTYQTLQLQPIPEPSAALLGALGALGLLRRRRI
jgi:hypothetical protein